jgi:type I restriction enzyme R subunit
MQNIIDICKEFGLEIPADKQSDFNKKVAENYVTKAEHDKKLNRAESDRDTWKEKAESAEETLKGFDGKDFDTITKERDEWKKKKDGDKEDITKDIVFEVELIKQIEINIDYILMLVKKYKDGNCEDKEIVVDIRRAVDASSELRSKKELIETFIANVNEMDDVFDDWRTFVKEQKEKEIDVIITEENLKADETKKFVDNAFRDGELKTTGVGIDSLLPPMRRFGGNSNRAEKKQTVIEKLKAFFEKYYGLVKF